MSVKAVTIVKLNQVVVMKDKQNVLLAMDQRDVEDVMVLIIVIVVIVILMMAFVVMGLVITVMAIAHGRWNVKIII